MYASLALTAPVVQITVNATTSSSSKAASHTGAIAGGIAGGVVALILLVGTVAFVRRRRQDDFRKSAGTSISGSPVMTVTPFNPALAEAAPLEEGPRFGTASDRPTSSSGPLLPPSQSVAPVPVGLTSKELARLRSTAIRSPLTSHAQTSSQPTYPLHITIDTGAGSPSTPTPETRRLQSEVESLRRAMQELRAERFEAPPSYGTGGGV
ncbi:hypothetical protein EDB86DRAFT_2906085 [Lactarius hatsudake]|nr:hypothetical protein EDB86DRAFT_2906085 [Lactarius hatsudake]